MSARAAALPPRAPLTPCLCRRSYSVLGRQKDSGFGLLPKLTEDRVVHAALGETGFAALVRTGAGAWQVCRGGGGPCERAACG